MGILLDSYRKNDGLLVQLAEEGCSRFMKVAQDLFNIFECRASNRLCDA